MSLSDLEAILKTATDDVYEREAPSGLTRFIVYNRYNFIPICGDDQRLVEIPRVQLDVCWQDTHDTLIEDVFAALNYSRIPYDVQDLGWDDAYQAYRCIVQLTLV